MEATFLAGVLAQPIALLVLITVLFASIMIGGQAKALPVPSPKIALSRGLLAVLLAALILAAASAYVSPEESKRLGVDPANYHSVLKREFLVFAILFSYASLVGCAVVGVPILVALATQGFATTPILVAASVPISLLFSVAIGSLSGAEPSHVREQVTLVAGVHALLALAFATGVGLPWRRNRTGSQAG